MTNQAFLRRAIVAGAAGTWISFALIAFVPVLGLVLAMVLCPAFYINLALGFYGAEFGIPAFRPGFVVLATLITILNVLIYVVMGFLFRWGGGKLFLVPIILFGIYLMALTSFFPILG